jgi:LysM repeat protein
MITGCTRSKPARTPEVTPKAAQAVVTIVATITPPPTVALTPTLVLPPTATPTAPPLLPTPVITVSAPLSDTLPQPTNTPSTVRHIVKVGETLSQLSRTYRTSPSAILAENPAIANPNQLSVGTTITITMGTRPPVRTHTVRRGESLASIARAYGVSMQALVQANGLQDPNQVKVGQLLVIPN